MWHLLYTFTDLCFSVGLDRWLCQLLCHCWEGGGVAASPAGNPTTTLTPLLLPTHISFLRSSFSIKIHFLLSFWLVFFTSSPPSSSVETPGVLCLISWELILPPLCVCVSVSPRETVSDWTIYQTLTSPRLPLLSFFWCHSHGNIWRTPPTTDVWIDERVCRLLYGSGGACWRTLSTLLTRSVIWMLKEQLVEKGTSVKQLAVILLSWYGRNLNHTNYIWAGEVIVGLFYFQVQQRFKRAA